MVYFVLMCLKDWSIVILIWGGEGVAKRRCLCSCFMELDELGAGGRELPLQVRAAEGQHPYCEYKWFGA